MSLPVELVKIIDLQAKLHYATRSEYIKNTLIARLKSEGVLNESLEHSPQDLYSLHNAQLKEFLKDYEFDEEE